MGSIKKYIKKIMIVSALIGGATALTSCKLDKPEYDFDIDRVYNQKIYELGDDWKKMDELFQAYNNKIYNSSSIIDENMIVKTFNGYKNILSQYFPSKNIKLVFVKDDAEKELLQKEFASKLDKNEPYSEREVYVVKEDTIFVGQLAGIYFDLREIAVEEYLREQIGMMKIGSLLDNILLTEYQKSENNYASLLGEIMSEYGNLSDYKYAVNPKVLINAFKTSVDINPELGKLGIFELITAHYETLAKKHGVEITKEEANNSLFLTMVYQLVYRYNRILEENNRRGNPTYSDIATEYIIPADGFFKSEKEGKRMTLQLREVRQDLEKHILNGNEEYLKENVVVIIADLFIKTKAYNLRSNVQRPIYDFIQDYKQYVSDEQAVKYGMGDLEQEFYKMYGYSGFEEFDAKADVWINDYEYYSKARQQSSQNQNNKQAKTTKYTEFSL